MSADPYVVSYSDWACIFESFVALGCFERVSGGVESAVGGDEYVVAEGYFCTIEDNEVEVGIEVFANFDVEAVVAVEWLFDEESLSSSTE